MAAKKKATAKKKAAAKKKPVAKKKAVARRKPTPKKKPEGKKSVARRKPNPLADLAAADIESAEPAIDIRRVTKLAERTAAAKIQSEADEAKAKESKKEYIRLSQEELPTLMKEAGMLSLKLLDGSTVEVTPDCSTAITAENKPAALAWLLENELGGVIKTNLSVSFGRGERDTATALRAKIQKALKDNTVELEEGVHASSLKSLVMERLREGKAIPHDLFSIHEFNKAVIKPPKK